MTENLNPHICDHGHPVRQDGSHTRPNDATPECAPAVSGSGKQTTRRRLNPGEKRSLMRELAKGEKRKSELAREYRISTGRVTQFSQEHEREIDQIKKDINNEFAGMWAAEKQNRIQAYQDEIDRMGDSNFFEHVRAKAKILHQISEELGQLPPRQQMVIMPVIHIVEADSGEDLTEGLT